ncbi:unnamed protein product [Prunus brigantina]
MYEFARLDCMTTITIFSRSRCLMEHSCRSGRRTRKRKQRNRRICFWGCSNTYIQGAGVHGTGFPLS